MSAVWKGTGFIMHIYLMRHGETDWNIVRRMQGRSDIPLNKTGLRQARQAAAGMESLPIDRILTSPLRRARQTAQAVAAGRGVPVLIEERLVEMGFGDLEGKLLEEYPEYQCIFTDPERYVPLGDGESYAELDARCGRVLDEVIRPLEGSYHDLLICSHGALIKGIVRRLLDRPLSQFWIDPPQPNCSCTVLECRGGNITLLEQGRVYR